MLKGNEHHKKTGLLLQQFHQIVLYSQLIFNHIKILTYSRCRCLFGLKLVINTLKNIEEALYLGKLNHIYKIDKKNDVYVYEIMGDHVLILLLGFAN